MSTDRTASLHLVPNERPIEAEIPGRVAFDGPSPKARPSDRLEPWRISEQTEAAFAARAARQRVCFELAAVVVVERVLVEHDLSCVHAPLLVEWLDQSARAARVEFELSEPLSAYLQSLSRSVRDEPRGLRGFVALPMRLSERIAHQGLDHLLDPELIDSAFAWERGAVLEGRTMSEWAGLELLRRR